MHNHQIPHISSEEAKKRLGDRYMADEDLRDMYKFYNNLFEKRELTPEIVTFPNPYEVFFNDGVTEESLEMALKHYQAYIELEIFIMFQMPGQKTVSIPPGAEFSYIPK